MSNIKTAEEILRKYFTPEAHYVKEAMEMRGLEYYSFEMAIKAMEEYRSQPKGTWIKQRDREPTEKDMPFVTYSDGHYELWNDTDWFFELTEKERLERKLWKPVK